MGPDALKQELIRLKATPREVLETPEYWNFFYPRIMNHYKLNESYTYRGKRLNIPIIAHGGNLDSDATPSNMVKWGGVTKKKFTFKSFSGDHFFIHELGDKYYNEILTII